MSLLLINSNPSPCQLVTSLVFLPFNFRVLYILVVSSTSNCLDGVMAVQWPACLPACRHVAASLGWTFPWAGLTCRAGHAECTLYRLYSPAGQASQLPPCSSLALYRLAQLAPLQLSAPPLNYF